MENYCFLCGRYGNTDRHHLIGGTGNRQLSEKYEKYLVVNLCRRCHIWAHEDPNVYKALHIYGEKTWIEKQNSTVEEFIRVFGKNYLWEE